MYPFYSPPQSLSRPFSLLPSTFTPGDWLSASLHIAAGRPGLLYVCILHCLAPHAGHAGYADLASCWDRQLAISVSSPWQWFCSTRTLSNSLEASLTAAALYHWPWHWMLAVKDSGSTVPNTVRQADVNGPAQTFAAEDKLAYGHSPSLGPY